MTARTHGDVVCFGETLIDFLCTAPGADTYLRQASGAPANAAVAVARLGGRTQFVGMLGTDAFGDYLLQSLSDAGVGTDYVRRTHAAPTALAFISLDARGERSFSFYRPPAADLLFAPEDFEAACFARTAIFHACSNSLTEPGIAQATWQGLAHARAAGALASIDLNLRPALWANGQPLHDRLWRTLEQADLVKLAREECEYLQADGMDADAVVARLLRNARLVLVTDGAAPVRWWTRDARGQSPTFAVQARDTTAAGDAFIGGLLHRLQDAGVDAGAFDAFLAQPGALAQALRHASACGALAVTRQGAFASLPTQDDVRALLDAHPA